MMAAVVVVKCLSLIVMSFLLLSDRYHRHDEDTKQNVLNKLDYIAHYAGGQQPEESMFA